MFLKGVYELLYYFSELSTAIKWKVYVDKNKPPHYMTSIKNHNNKMTKLYENLIIPSASKMIFFQNFVTEWIA